jgi:4-hydroxybenzoate polyprenyltransferase
MFHFFRLVRPINLLIITLTLYGIKWFSEYRIGVNSIEIHFNSFFFFLFTLSIVLIAASGNIINDYFDIRADRINKPDRLIITKHIKRRWAILLHWTFNIIAFTIGLLLSYKLKNWWIVGIHFFTINVLWFYSVYFKRKVIIGNILIALLTALVPICCGIYLKSEILLQANAIPEGTPIRHFFPGRMIMLLTCLAFVQNWIREIIKDAQDIKGDLAIKATTLPMIISKKTLTAILTILLTILPIFLFFQVTFFLKLHELQTTRPEELVSINIIKEILLGNIPLYLAGLLNFVCIYHLWVKKQINYKKIDVILKLSLLVGLTLPIYRIFHNLFLI